MQSLVWDNVPPFAILTGVNGAGKTHLLELLAYKLTGTTHPQNLDLSQIEATVTPEISARAVTVWQIVVGSLAVGKKTAQNLLEVTVSEGDVVPPYPKTPDRRYMVVRGRLWRLSNPALDKRTRQLWVDKLMAARREIHVSRDNPARIRHARDAVNKAKIALGERGQVWWDDGDPDYNRHLVVNTPYASWFEAIKSCCTGR